MARSGYRRSRRGDPIVTGGSLALVAALGSGFLFMSPIFVKKQTSAPVVVTLLALPDDPPPARTPPPSEAPLPPAQITVPAPIVPTVERPVLQTTTVAAPTPEAAPSRPAPPAPAAPRGPENLGELSAKMISAEPPRYPIDSRRGHEEGTVILSVLLSTDGRVSDISIMRSSGFARLDRAALDAVRNWRWSPLMRDGNAVMVRGVVTIPFVLQVGGRDGGPDHGHGRGARDHDHDGGRGNGEPGPSGDQADRS